MVTASARRRLVAKAKSGSVLMVALGSFAFGSGRGLRRPM